MTNDIVPRSRPPELGRVRFGRRRTGQRDRGYILLVVLAVSVLVITVLGMLAKLSLRRGLEAADAQRNLQQRWGALTLQRAMLKQAPAFFQLQEERAAELTPGVPPPETIRVALSLGDVTFDLLIGDEDAKLNLNALYHHAGLKPTEDALSNIVGPGAGPSFRLIPACKPLLLPRTQRKLLSETTEEEEEIPDAFRSWGEVFDLGMLESQLAGGAALPNLTTGITCWGNGQLNFRRASDQAILAVAGSVVQDGGARRLLMRHRDQPGQSLSVLLQAEVSSPDDRDRLREMLSETSTNFSVWIDASTRAGGSLRYFTVMRRDEEGVTRQTKFMH